MFQNHCCVSIDFIWLHKIATLFRINTWCENKLNNPASDPVLHARVKLQDQLMEFWVLTRTI